MNKQLLALLILCLIGCGEVIQKSDLENLNGYWEITKVEFPGGGEKEYGINTTIDYIDIEDGKGFRKKVQPKLDGTYRTSNDAEHIAIKETNEQFLIQYQSGQQGREEVLLKITKKTFIVENKEGIRYHYKRYEPINLN